MCPRKATKKLLMITAVDNTPANPRRTHRIHLKGKTHRIYKHRDIISSTKANMMMMDEIGYTLMHR
jgi:hypothetical protein